mmetsp:Transcript_14281/g.40544  ORF Transcript_14281/g.40544 Transcript_14281/m.40544 type:complete len:329 (+) Transcript_14281:246-1232(+)
MKSFAGINRVQDNSSPLCNLLDAGQLFLRAYRVTGSFGLDGLEEVLCSRALEGVSAPAHVVQKFLAVLVEVLRRVADAVRMNFGLKAGQVTAQADPSGRSTAAASHHEVREIRGHLLHLLRDLLHEIEVSPRAQGVGSPDRDDVRLPALFLEPLLQLPAQLDAPDPRVLLLGHLDDVGAHEALHEEVSYQPRVFVHLCPRVPQDEISVETHVTRCDGSCPAVIGLNSSNGDDSVTPLRLGLREEELQLSNFVPAQLHAGKVVPLDVDLAPFWQSRQVPAMYRRWELAQPHSTVRGLLQWRTFQPCRSRVRHLKLEHPNTCCRCCPRPR